VVPVPPVKPPHVITCPCCGDLRRFSQPRTRRRHLLALGADPGTVHMATRSRKGYWRMSQNEIVRFALNNCWLEEQGVPDLRAILIVLHHGPKARV
jgi:hypothetical protein